MNNSIQWAYTAGGNDAYYGRNCSANFYVNGNVLRGTQVTNLTEEEREAYLEGYNDETDGKDWG